LPIEYMLGILELLGSSKTPQQLQIEKVFNARGQLTPKYVWLTASPVSQSFFRILVSIGTVLHSAFAFSLSLALAFVLSFAFIFVIVFVKIVAVLQGMEFL